MLNAPAQTPRPLRDCYVSPIDKLGLFREGVRTQIKRAYESSVCRVRRFEHNAPAIASAGVPQALGLSSATAGPSRYTVSDV